jgi:hypothetical protein
VIDELRWHGAELLVEFLEILIEQITLEFVFDRASDEAAQTTIAHPGLDPLSQTLLHADRPLLHSHIGILPR